MPYSPTRKRDQSSQQQVAPNRSEEERKADAFDRQIEEDAKAGRLDAIADRARAQYWAGNATDLKGTPVDPDEETVVG